MAHGKQFNLQSGQHLRVTACAGALVRAKSLPAIPGISTSPHAYPYSPHWPRALRGELMLLFVDAHSKSGHWLRKMHALDLSLRTGQC